VSTFSQWLSLQILGTDNTTFNSSSIVRKHVCCQADMFISCYLENPISSGSTIPVLQLTCHTMIPVYLRYPVLHLYLKCMMRYFYILQLLKVKLSLYRPWRPLGLREVEAPTFSDIWQTDGSKVVSPMRRPLFNPGKIPGTHFC
jgi:hypothetical protein